MKNDIVKLKIEDIDKDGQGIAKFDNKVYFVKDGLIGDEVEAIVTKESKNYNYAKVVNIIKKSDFRVDGNCSVCRACGGCQLLELSYDKQIELKINFVKNNLLRITKIDKDIVDTCFDGIITMDNPYKFRNKVQVPFARREDKVISGFYAGRTHYIIEHDNCITSFEYSDDIINIVKNLLIKHNITVYSETTKHGKFRELVLRKANNTDELSVTFILNDKNYLKNIDTYKKMSIDLVRDIEKYKSINNVKVTSVTLNINTDITNTLLGDINVNLYGNEYIEDELSGIKFRISNNSFYQINMKLTEKLYNTAIDYAKLSKDDTVLDLYCGIGTISLIMSKYAKNVVGIEIVEKAIENAKVNAEINNINNAKFLCADVNTIFDKNNKYYFQNGKSEIYESILKSNVVCVDPPRKGLDTNTKNFINELKPKKIVYISCDSATLARDLSEFINNGYKLIKYKLVDMFAHTMHVETCVLLEL